MSAQELQERSEQLTRQVRQRFTRTVLGRKVEYAGWRPVPLPHTPEEEEANRASSPSPSVITGDLADPDDPTDDLYVALATSKAESAARKKKTGSKARVKVVVPDPRDPARSKVKYVYDHSHACHICGKTFAWQGHLTKHLQTHTGERPLNCHICGQTFRWSSHLTSHLRRHNDDKPFVCNVCGKRFVSSSVFKGHMRTHTDEKPFMCGVCGKQFRDKSNLRTHEWVHTDKRPHRCGPCDRGFLTTSALKLRLTASSGAGFGSGSGWARLEGARRGRRRGRGWPGVTLTHGMRSERAGNAQ
ncbi:zinc finger and SCAN domain-containing protein 21-like [Pollicipes pollicipes]|uniref:zinc finger and SCAN domain-containing protein 21-like n=1 Tax=Pollicipes pollicipes TaxID=41117 RepID=UPI001884B509|nr:zinc finger and SCAN domain-containing protein 21-like [Pollicipes pollicipes]XP_037085816.1 zinc finger and SCAN domain-containing protein 21-like [Pollicipes pollicipes]